MPAEDRTTLHRVLLHLQTLDWLPAPTVALEDDGEIGLDFDLARRCTLSLSVSEAGEVGWAALVGTHASYGRFALSVYPQWSPDLNAVLDRMRHALQEKADG